MTTATLEHKLKRDRFMVAEEIGLEPSALQSPILECTARERLVAGGERSGKSEIGADDMFGSIFALEAELVWLFGADYGETSQEYQYTIRNAQKLGMLKSAKKQSNPGEIVLHDGEHQGTIIKTVSGKDITKIGREAPDYILVCEAAKIDYLTYLRLRARLAEKKGYLLLTGTFESSLGWYPELFNLWQVPGADGVSFSMPSWSNLAKFKGGREDEEILRQERSMPSDLFKERFGGIPCPPYGLVFKEFRVTLHVGTYDYDPTLPVHIGVDPGYAGACAVEVVQIKNDIPYVIDEIYERGLTQEQIIVVCKHRPWWDKVVGGVIDIAGRAHHEDKSAEEVWLKEGDLRLKSQKVGVIDGINRFRTFLLPDPITGWPHFYIDHKAKGLIAELGGGPSPLDGGGMWRYKTDSAGLVVSELPDDKDNHACKAIIYLLVDRFGLAGGKRKAPKSKGSMKM
ncbi:hypothetical protein LCGC14_0370240 [marine sediment metagenome]|uniref:Terminase large subunit gp17-like C-terminal domain-containing protein n=1 Tax=marine sediment metagenome TaxID=412755 RepID=A0A0F9T5K6_9ZZZZ